MKSQILKDKKKFFIFPTIPFHFDSTFYKPGHFSTSDTKWKLGKRWQTMLWKGEKLGLIFENKSVGRKPKILVNVFSDKKLLTEFIEGLKKEIILRFNLDLNLAEFYQMAKKDTLLKPIIRRLKGLRPMHFGSLYEYLIIAILLQNATIKRSVYMMQALFENYGSLLQFDNQKFWCFWEPKILAKAKEQKLRDLKMGYRAKSLIKVSEPFVKGEINELELRTKSYEEQEKALVNLYGIGPASTGYIMFDVFHRWDYLNHISPWEQKIYTKIFFNKNYEKELVSVEKMLRYFDKWGKWKNLAIHYVWEDLWWKRRNKHISWLEKEIRL